MKRFVKYLFRFIDAFLQIEENSAAYLPLCSGNVHIFKL